MRFLFGLALVILAIAIWRFIGRRPPVLRTLENGDRVLGPPATTRPSTARGKRHLVRRIARDPAPTERLDDVVPGCHLAVTRDGDRWLLSDDDGPVAHVGRPGASRDEPSDALTAATGNLPDKGRLWVDRVLEDRDGHTLDLRGIVIPAED